ncbi:hypothetical protein NKH18_24095 [Streptomyces sp. M10(2022)]
MALGAIAAESYTYLCDQLFHGWAQSDDWMHRDAVAYALQVAAREPWIGERTDILVEGWFADRSSPFAQATAARVHGLSTNPEAAVSALVRLAAVDRAAVAVAIGRSLTDLLAQGIDPALMAVTVDPSTNGSRARSADPGLVLRALHERSADHQRRPAAVLSFLIVASQLAVGGAGSEMERWPALLYLAHYREELRAPFIALWRESLNQAAFGEEAQQVLRNWAALAERDRALRDMFQLMVGAIAYQDARTGRILRRCAADWVDRTSSHHCP